MAQGQSTTTIDTHTASVQGVQEGRNTYTAQGQSLTATYTASEQKVPGGLTLHITTVHRGEKNYICP